MRDTGTETDEGPACKVVAGGDGKVAGLAAIARRRRRRLELRRLGRKASAAAEDEAAKRVRSGRDRSSSDSSAETDHGMGWPASLSHGAVSVIGRRRAMEDAVAVARTFLASADVSKGGGADGCGGEDDFFAVYDGHGGPRVAQVCRERMHVVLAEEVGLRRRFGSDVRWKEAMAASFARVDSEATCGFAPAKAAAADADAYAPFRTVGSTAVVAVVGHRRIVVANCGDSRAVLSRGGVAVPLSTDHKPDRPDELERVEAAGGRVINWNGYRVLGVLATSRSIGDYYLKPYVSAEPEVTVVDRTDQDEFLILASDGLWDVVSNEVACKIARKCLNGRAASMFPESVSGRTAADAAALLTELAMSRGSNDNISVVVVELRRLKGSS
ncbi:protein phosphatase 2C 51-like isoform X2 [Phragmites australis]|uniref:protein phosphatase 2C 51-like isoform X2 n=1 Tax=Phragmites australis TaxID=29695 RepID=UPI002D797741|nr:protein phosphatase 2C 51-like isoform X2 [Phragmites australis]